MSALSEDHHVALHRPEAVIVAPTVLVTILQVLAVSLIVGGLAKGGAALQVSPRGGSLAVGAILGALGWVVAGCSGGALLWSIGWLVRRLHGDAVARQQMLHALEAGGGREPIRPAVLLHATGGGEVEQLTGGDQTELLQRLLSEIMEMNANLLMSQNQREAKGRHRQERLARDLLAAFEAALAGHEFAHAEVCISQFEIDLPDDARLAEMVTRLAETRAAAEARDVETETRQAEDLMAVGSFDDARQVAEALGSAYPASDSARALAERVEREAAAVLREQRQRLYADVQSHAGARRWCQALEAAKRLMETCPGTSEADAASAMLTTIEDNARIEEARKLRDHLRDMVTRRRYTEAVAIAQDLMERFPNSHAANDLQGQMARLRELAAEEGR